MTVVTAAGAEAVSSHGVAPGEAVRGEGAPAAVYGAGPPVTRALSHGGFVLLEAVVALAILGAFVVGVLAATGGQVRTAAQGSELLTAVSLAEDRLDAIRRLDHEGIADPPDSLVAGAFPTPFEDFGWTTAVEEIEDEYDLFGVEVVVTGPTQTLPIRTLVHRARPVLAASGEGGRGSGGGGR